MSKRLEFKICQYVGPLNLHNFFLLPSTSPSFRSPQMPPKQISMHTQTGKSRPKPVDLNNLAEPALPSRQPTQTQKQKNQECGWKAAEMKKANHVTGKNATSEEEETEVDMAFEDIMRLRVPMKMEEVLTQSA